LFCEAREGAVGSVGRSGRFECDVCVDELDRFGQSRGDKAEGALGDASLAVDVIGDIEGSCLTFAGKRPASTVVCG
jgi:hypothetical protein